MDGLQPMKFLDKRLQNYSYTKLHKKFLVQTHNEPKSLSPQQHVSGIRDYRLIPQYLVQFFVTFPILEIPISSKFNVKPTIFFQFSHYTIFQS